ncbi:MAG: hypothetical protein ACKVH0_04295 [Alphaproteobacteria bacterium]|jgi:hypothetical protein
MTSHGHALETGDYNHYPDIPNVSGEQEALIFLAWENGADGLRYIGDGRMLEIRVSG